MLIFTAAIFLSFALSFLLPAWYARAALAAEESCKQVSADHKEVSKRPVLAACLLTGGTLPVWLLTHDMALTLFIILLACAAYVDAITRWVPDVLIFLLSWVALLAAPLSGYSPVSMLTGAAVMMCPALMINLAAWLQTQRAAIATGDLYILPAMGVWLSPEWAGCCIGSALFLTIAISRYVREAPFITILYPIFLMVKLCGA